MKVKDLHYLLSQALINTPEIADMPIEVDTELDTTMKIGVIAKHNLVLILGKDSYLGNGNMEVYSYE